MIHLDVLYALGYEIEVEVFDFYDYPRLFSGQKSKSDTNIVLVISVDEDKNNNTKWMCVEMSAFRYALLEAGKITVTDAFKNSESKDVKIVTLKEQNATVETISSILIPKEYIPMVDFYLEQ